MAYLRCTFLSGKCHCECTQTARGADCFLPTLCIQSTPLKNIPRRGLPTATTQYTLIKNIPRRGLLHSITPSRDLKTSTNVKNKK